MSYTSKDKKKKKKKEENTKTAWTTKRSHEHALRPGRPVKMYGGSKGGFYHDLTTPFYRSPQFFIGGFQTKIG